MMQDCHKNMQAMQQSNTKTKQDIEAARQSNDPAKMRAALDEADKALTSMNDHMNSCMSMMNMMQGMHGKGMMSGQQSSPPKQ
jgi:phage shock protein A